MKPGHPTAEPETIPDPDGKGTIETGRYSLPFKPRVLKLKVSRTVTMADLRAREIPARVYLPMLGQDGYFIQGKTHMLAAFPKTGKTELIAACLHDWISRPIMRRDGESYPTILYLGEESEDAWTERLQNLPASRDWDQVDYVPALGMTTDQMLALAHSHGGDPDDWSADFASGPVPKTDLVIADEVVGYDLVIIDAMRSLLGVENENDNSEVTAKVKPWVQMSQRTGATLIILHHTRKTGGEYGLGAAGGSGSIALLDRILTMDRDPDHDERRFVTATGRGMADPDKAIIGWTEDTTAQGIRTGQYRLEYMGAAGRVRKGDIAARVLEAVKQAQRPLTTQEVSDKLLDPPVPGLRTVQNVLKELAYVRRIVRDPDINESAERRRVTWSAAVDI